VIFYILIALVAAAVSFGFSFAILKLSHRYRLYPKIRERDVHDRPTPRLGGVAMFFGVVVAFATASFIPNFSLIFSEPLTVWGLIVASLIIVLVGVADDIWDLDWTTKLAGQIIAAGLLVWSGSQILQIPVIGGVAVLPTTISLIITVLVVVLVMNAINFIDGLDGLVAGIAIITNSVFFLYSYLLVVNVGNTESFNLAFLISAVLIGVCAGFLPLNFRPAKLFMGDAGALLVGLLMAASAITLTAGINPETWHGGRQALPAFIPILLPFAVLIVPLLDFVLAVFRRLRAGQSPFTADRKHLHHRLLDMGHGHLGAVLIFYGWTTVFALGCLSFMFLSTVWSVILISIGLLACAFVTFSPMFRRRFSTARGEQ
jgi:UDP-GlcNAc:undecaprenyl-phosphate/decaprenyl-phosphate GlcNAc-1-phosphate transferase